MSVSGLFSSKHSHSKVHVLLSLVSNAMIIHGHLPSSFMDSIIVPLVKDEKGDINLFATIDHWQLLVLHQRYLTF